MSRSILDYFAKEHCKADLPDPRSPLSSKILPSTIAAANTEVMRVMNGPSELELLSPLVKKEARTTRVQGKSSKIATHNQTLYSSPE